MTTINDLSDKILIKIFSYIHMQERQRLATVCKQWESIIEVMWKTIHKLIINMAMTNSSYTEWEGANCANILCSKIATPLKVIKKCNGNLTKLEFRCDFFETHLSIVERLEWDELCKEIQKHEQLTSVKMNNHSANDRNMYLQFLRHLPTKNLQHLSIPGPDDEYENFEDFIESFKTLTRATSGLEYLHMKYHTPSIEKIIVEIHTLESLHLGYEFCYREECPSLFNIMKFSNLRELTIHNWYLVDDEFLIGLSNNCESLRTLDLQHESHVSQSGFNSIGKLENLSYLKLSINSSVDIGFLNNLSNLEEFYIDFRWWRVSDGMIQQLQCVLKNMPKLKQCWFYDCKIHGVLTSSKIVEQSQLKEPHDLHCAIWKRIFGIP